MSENSRKSSDDEAEESTTYSSSTHGQLPKRIAVGTGTSRKVSDDEKSDFLRAHV